jgi:hypothetical protein
MSIYAKFAESRSLLLASILCFFALVACSPEPGSKAWCENLDKKAKGEWTSNETLEYAKSCLLK